MSLLALSLLSAAVSDVRRYMIPNWLVAGVVATFATNLFAEPLNPSDIALHLAAGVIILILGFFLFAKGLFGGGDAKLLAAMALWTGFSDLPRFLAVTTIAGAVLAIAVLLQRRMTSSGAQIDHRLPYGVAIAVGGLDFCIRQTDLMKITSELFAN